DKRKPGRAAGARCAPPLREFPESILMQSTTERMGLIFTRSCLLLLCGLSSGCAALSLARPMSAAVPASQGARPGGAAPEPGNQGIALLSYPHAPPATSISQPGDPPFTGQAELSVEALIEHVLA